jgi:hypothetical protein
MGQRSALATVLAAFFGATAPVIHHRSDHIVLMSHYVFIFALSAAVSPALRRRVNRGAAIVLCLCLLSVTLNLYLYVMTAAVAAAYFARAFLSGRLGAAPAVLCIAAIVAIGSTVAWIFGLASEPAVAAMTFSSDRAYTL